MSMQAYAYTVLALLAVCHEGVGFGFVGMS